MKNKRLLRAVLVCLALVGGFGLAPAAPAVKTVRVTVSKKGYTPASVNVKKGQKVKMIFYRADTQNCGGEVVFPALNIRQSLPLKKAVTIEFTPQEAGELSFTCGMGMMRGAVVVSN